MPLTSELERVICEKRIAGARVKTELSPGEFREGPTGPRGTYEMVRRRGVRAIKARQMNGCQS